MNKNKKAMSKGAIIYFVFIAVIAIALLTVTYLEESYIKDQEEKYNYSTEKGEKLVDCGDGTYDVYKPDELSFTCLNNNKDTNKIYN